MIITYSVNEIWHTKSIIIKTKLFFMISDENKLTALIENYKMVNEDVRSYQSEMIKCFLYAVAIIAIGLGYGIVDKNVDKIVDYMPLALAGLIIYFLTLGTMYVSASRYKAQIEAKINKLANDNLFEYDLVFKPMLLRIGVLPNSKGNKRFPLPNAFLGLVIWATFLYLVYRSTILHSYFWYILGGSILIALIGVYTFIGIPKIIERYQRTNGDIP
jgi:hypothetical protein